MIPADPLAVDALLAQHWPDARCDLAADDPWRLLVAVILSARASDAQVNRVLPILDEHLLGVHAYAQLDPRELEPLLRHLPLYRQKARAVVEAARAVLRRGGVVPQTVDELEQLPGVGRKTACVVAGNAFGIPAIGADTHVQRIAFRLGWTSREHPTDAENAIMTRLPRGRWVQVCHQLIRLGREWCRRVGPKCHGCPLNGTCPKQQ